MRADGTPAQPGDDPSQLYWLINSDQAADNLLAPPPGLEAPSPAELALIPGVENTGLLSFWH